MADGHLDNFVHTPRNQSSAVSGHRIAELWTHASDLARSLWDAEQLLFVIELDHQNVDVPSDPFLHPAAVFLTMEPTFQAALRVFQIDRKRTGKPDHDFLESVFLKLMLNFTWWVNRKDASGNNVFQGGFLGLDNIGVFDRSNELPLSLIHI